jgi:small subunit ribosomal protein S17
MATDKGKSKAPAKGAKSPQPKADKAAPPKAVAKAPAPKEAKPAPKAAAVPAAPPVPKDLTAASTSTSAHGFRRKLLGRVVSDKMDKTVTVEVVRNALDTVYRKYVRQRARYKAHDEQNQFRTGDRVEIQEHRPLSREKRWLVTRLVSRPVEE